MMEGMSISRLGGRLPRGAAAALTVAVAALLGVSACSAAATSSGPAAGSTQTGSAQRAGSTPQAAGPIVPAQQHAALAFLLQAASGLRRA